MCFPPAIRLVSSLKAVIHLCVAKKAKNIILKVNWSQPVLLYVPMVGGGIMAAVGGLGSQDDLLFGKACLESFGYKGFFGRNEGQK